MKIGGTISGAVFSGDDRRFRYALWRRWNNSPKNLDALLFIGLNPSTANVTKDDPTIRRLVNFAKSWGFGGLFVGNLFSIVSADPAVLFLEPSSLKYQILASVELPGGPNDDALRRMRDLCSLVVVGWGEHGKFAGTRTAEVMALIGEPVHCFKVNHSGEPTHPLYLPGNSKPIRYYRKGASHG